MCIRRLELRPDHRDIEHWEENAFVDDIATAKAQAIGQLYDGERNLRDATGRLSYLLDLQEHGADGTCPICFETLGDCCALLHCGHRLCVECIRDLEAHSGPTRCMVKISDGKESERARVRMRTRKKKRRKKKGREGKRKSVCVAIT